ncbi:MAG: hypothetical protein RMK40_07260 [Chloroflexota bacterium]|nr:hypothetical protein [Chloroflexota bacterium]
MSPVDIREWLLVGATLVGALATVALAVFALWNLLPALRQYREHREREVLRELTVLRGYRLEALQRLLHQSNDPSEHSYFQQQVQEALQEYEAWSQALINEYHRLALRIARPLMERLLKQVAETKTKKGFGSPRQ